MADVSDADIFGWFKSLKGVVSNGTLRRNSHLYFGWIG